MLGFIIVYFLAWFLGLQLALGLSLYIIGNFPHFREGDLKETGVEVMKLPIGCVIFIALCVLSSIVYNVFSATPTKEDVVGTYRVVKIEGLNISKESAALDSLVLRADNTYSITQIFEAGIERCTNETYTYNPDKQNFRMSRGMFDLECGFRSFQIKYTCGDPDDGGCIYFEKIPE